MKKLKINIPSAIAPDKDSLEIVGKNACRNRMVVVPGSLRPRPEDESAEQDDVVTGKNTCRTHMVVVPGYGAPSYPLPSADQVVSAACNRLTEIAKQASARRRRRGSGASESVEVDILHMLGRRQAIPPFRGGQKKLLMSQIPGGVAAGGSGSGPALFAAAEGFRVIFHNGRFEATVAEKFDRLTGAVNWARNNMSAKYQPAIESLTGHLDQLKNLYRETLPRVMNFLAAQYPEAGQEELLQAAVSVIDEQLQQILYVLSIWTDAFGQLRDGEYDELQAVIFTVEQAYHLFRTGDISGHCDEECQKRLKSRVFGVEDVFVARFSGQGPATIPGSRGPVGAHAIEVPHDERDIITLMLVLYLHEFRHDVFHDVEGLAEEMVRVVVEAIQQAHRDGKFKFSTEFIKLGNQKVKTVDLITKIFADTVSEVDADIAGGVLLSGPAFLYNMLATFSAFNAKENGVFNQDVLLRSKSVYEVDEQGSLIFAPHLPDYFRVYSVAAALESLGFKAEAEDCRQMADQAAGVPLPTEITWVDAERKRKMAIKVPVADLRQVAPVVADAIMRTPLKSLGGVSMAQIINWTPRRQMKVDLLVQNLMAGKADVPADKGDYFATYVAAAATLAYWGLVKAGTHPIHAGRQVEVNALKMLDTVRERMAAKERAEKEAEAKAEAEADAPGSAPDPAAGAGETPKS